MQIKPYEHKAQYYETDQMGIIHHSNYIRWFEEARIDFLEQVGMGYEKMEEQGVISPVLAVTCEYKSMTKFGQTVRIWPEIKAYNGVKLTIGYKVEDTLTQEVRCIGESKHCFLSREGRPISLKRSYPEVSSILEQFLEEKQC
ncbi:MAG: acyl-CoA thioesterase [Cellulosilyticaceae bacterium]